MCKEPQDARSLHSCLSTTYIPYEVRDILYYKKNRNSAVWLSTRFGLFKIQETYFDLPFNLVLLFCFFTITVCDYSM